MSAARKRFQVGRIDCGGCMSRKIPIYVHLMGFCVMAGSMLFSYAALLQNGALPGFVGFGFGVIFLLLLYGHELDLFYIHVGNKIKIGGESYDPERQIEDEAYIEIDENDNHR